MILTRKCLRRKLTWRNFIEGVSIRAETRLTCQHPWRDGEPGLLAARNHCHRNVCVCLECVCFVFAAQLKVPEGVLRADLPRTLKTHRLNIQDGRPPPV